VTRLPSATHPHTTITTWPAPQHAHTHTHTHTLTCGVGQRFLQAVRHPQPLQHLLRAGRHLGNVTVRGVAAWGHQPQVWRLEVGAGSRHRADVGWGLGRHQHHAHTLKHLQGQAVAAHHMDAMCALLSTLRPLLPHPHHIAAVARARTRPCFPYQRRIRRQLLVVVCRGLLNRCCCCCCEQPRLPVMWGLVTCVTATMCDEWTAELLPAAARLLLCSRAHLIARAKRSLLLSWRSSSQPAWWVAGTPCSANANTSLT
jgi:hypothetical protein